MIVVTCSRRLAVVIGITLVAVALAAPIVRAQDVEPAAADQVLHDPIRGGGRYIIPIWGCRGPGLALPTPPPAPTPDPRPGAPGSLVYQPCPKLTGRVPATVLQYAIANPHAIRGYGVLRNPNVPANPWNAYRTWLSLVDWGKPWSVCNSVVWTAGCS
jgi:hypothetical protein